MFQRRRQLSSPTVAGIAGFSTGRLLAQRSTFDQSIRHNQAARPGNAAASGRRFGMGLIALVAFGLQVLLHFTVVVDIGWQPGEHVHLVAALISFSVIAVPLVALLPRTRSRAAATQLVGSALMVLALLAVVGNPDNQGGQAGVYDLVVAVVWGLPLVVGMLVRPRTPERARVHWPLAVLAAFAAPAAVVGAVNQELIQRNSWPPALDPHHNAHWVVAGIAILAPVVAVAIASRRRRGWRLPLWTGGLQAIVLGLASVAFADDASSLGLGWGVAMAIWGSLSLIVGHADPMAITERMRVRRSRPVRDRALAELQISTPAPVLEP